MLNFHGYERNTSDLDIWVKSSTENLIHIADALKDLGFDDFSIEHIKTFDLNKPFLFHIGSKPNDIEVFNFVTGVKYEDAELHKILFNYSSKFPVYFISIRDLILNKMLTHRTQDKLDVEMLQKIQKL
ncbi:MAG: hypothetical protein JWO03_2714 [Bacteroidetes bacterium]|nr:hypothetical protein [Bacteroidota bacterium]